VHLALFHSLPSQALCLSPGAQTFIRTSFAALLVVMSLLSAHPVSAQIAPTTTISTGRAPANTDTPAPTVTPMDADRGMEWADTPMPEPIAPQATDQYWDAIARCETATRWQRDFVFGGGLGIYHKSWQQYGGEEFAPRAGLATRNQQIIVANRISTQGYRSAKQWYYRPLGFSGWGCARHMTPPVLLWHSTAWLLAQDWPGTATAAQLTELQAALGIAETGQWDTRTEMSVRAARERYALQLGFTFLGPYHPLPKKQRQRILLQQLRVLGEPPLVATSEPNTTDRTPSVSAPDPERTNR
jgi:Transglycosylase-like domain